MKPNIISRMGCEKEFEIFEIFCEYLNFPSSPLPGIINDRSLTSRLHDIFETLFRHIFFWKELHCQINEGD